jgi:hypothetical protein
MTATMPTKKAKWLAYTVVVGLLPVISRLIVWLVTKDENVAPFSAQDFIALGLVLHITNINEIEHLATADSSWKTVHNGASAFCIAMYGLLFSLALMGEDTVNHTSIMYCVAAASLASLSISYRLFSHISSMNHNQRLSS